MGDNDTVFMAKRDLQVRHSAYGVRKFQTEANQYVGLEVGDGVNLGGTGANYAIPCLDGTPTQGTDIMLGVTHNASSATVAADGLINVEIVGPGSIVSGHANTPTNMNTAALLNGIRGDYVKFNRSAATVAGILTIDENLGSGKTTSGLFILDGDIIKGTLDVFIAQANIFRS